jgi:hypothetical protein
VVSSLGSATCQPMDRSKVSRLAPTPASSISHRLVLSIVNRGYIMKLGIRTRRQARRPGKLSGPDHPKLSGINRSGDGRAGLYRLRENVARRGGADPSLRRLRPVRAARLWSAEPDGAKKTTSRKDAKTVKNKCFVSFAPSREMFLHFHRMFHSFAGRGGIGTPPGPSTARGERNQGKRDPRNYRRIGRGGEA